MAKIVANLLIYFQFLTSENWNLGSPRAPGVQGLLEGGTGSPGTGFAKA